MAAHGESAGRQTIDPSLLVNVPRLVTAYFAGEAGSVHPRPARRFRHLRPSRFRCSQFLQREPHPRGQPGDLRLPQGCRHRRPLFIGIDTAALAEPALVSALEVFAANGVHVRIDPDDRLYADAGDLPRHPDWQQGAAHPVWPMASWSRRRNPPEDGGFKYNPPNGGPADTDITGVMEKAANGFLENDMAGVKRIPISARPANPNS